MPANNELSLTAWRWLWMNVRLTMHVVGYEWYMTVNRQQVKQKSTQMDWMKYSCRRSERYCVFRRLTGSSCIKSTAVSSFPISIMDSLKSTASFPRTPLYMLFLPRVFFNAQNKQPTREVSASWKHEAHGPVNPVSLPALLMQDLHLTHSQIPDVSANKQTGPHVVISVACSECYSKCRGKTIRNPLTIWSHAFMTQCLTVRPDTDSH